MSEAEHDAEVLLEAIRRLRRDLDERLRAEWDRSLPFADATFDRWERADALGFGCVWRTGGYATDPHIIEALGGDPGDRVIGFLYIGTRDGPSKLLSEEPLESLVSYF